MVIGVNGRTATRRNIHAPENKWAVVHVATIVLPDSVEINAEGEGEESLGFPVEGDAVLEQYARGV